MVAPLSTDINRRIRYLFRTGDIDREFCWFERRGDDLYWGPSRGRTVKGATATSNERGMTITVPDEIEFGEPGSWKASFHASGQFHFKQDGKLVGPPDQWRLKTEIEAPYCVAAYVSKPPKLYDPYPSVRSLTRRRSYAQVVVVNGRQAETRHYFEFIVSPTGTFTFPHTILSLSRGDNTAPLEQPLLFSLSERLVLAVRHFCLSPESGLSVWHPELSFWIHGGDESNDPLGAV